MAHSPKVQWGFVSTADIASKNFRAVSAAKNAECVAVASRDLEKAKRWAHERHIGKAYGSYDELLADSSIQAVYIPLPTALHKEWVIKAAAAGKHVLCDKPVGINGDEVKEMTAACVAAGVQFMDGVMFMHHKRLGYIEKYIRGTTESPEPVVGKLRKVTVGFTFAAEEKFFKDNIRVKKELEPLGCVGDLAWYCIRFALFAFNYEQPTKVSAFQHEATPEGVPLVITATVWFPDGKLLTFDCGFSTVFRQWAEIAGTKGHIHLDDFTIARSPESTSFRVMADPGIVDAATRVSAKVTDVEVLGCSQETAMFEHFSELVLENRRDAFWPRVTLQTQIICDSIMESLAAGGACVDIPKM